MIAIDILHRDGKTVADFSFEIKTIILFKNAVQSAAMGRKQMKIVLQ